MVENKVVSHFDSLKLEAGKVSTPQSSKLRARVVYGDLGTSPLFVLNSTFAQGIGPHEDVVGILSLIFYTLTLIPLIKYALIVLGDICTVFIVVPACEGELNSKQPARRKGLSNYKLGTPSNGLKQSQAIKKKLENTKIAQYVLFLVTIMGTSMVLGDGIRMLKFGIECSPIRGLSSNFTFAPILILWFLFISGIGVYNLITHDISVLRAVNPIYIFCYFHRNGKQAWISLGGVVLCTTSRGINMQAMRPCLPILVTLMSKQYSFSCIIFPALIMAYGGQAAYLSKFPEKVENIFYNSVPIPMEPEATELPKSLVLGRDENIHIRITPLGDVGCYTQKLSATIVGSQSMISETFSIISQSLSLGCFPRVKVVHTSSKYEGQVYIPEVNYMLMVACVTVTAIFKTGDQISNAYGIAVVSVMVITTCLLTLIMLVVWKTSIWLIGTYLSAVLFKFFEGGYPPLCFAAVLMVVMGIWHHVHKQRYMFELKNKVSSEHMKQLASDPNINRVPERFIFRQLEPREYRMFRCVVRYGYNDRIEEPKDFEQQLVENLKEFIQNEHFILGGGTTEKSEEAVTNGQSFNTEKEIQQVNPPRVSSGSIQSLSAASSTNPSRRIVSAPSRGAEEEMQFVQEAMDKDIVYLLGEAEVVAEEKSSLFKKIIVNYAYNFLRKNFRHGEEVMAVPRTRLLRVGMMYEI
ncbi:unnamed protein product [Malus baccata var. baccata]